MLNTGELVMDIGTILEGEEAVEEGLIDEVGTVSNAIDALYDLIKENKESKPKFAEKITLKKAGKIISGVLPEYIYIVTLMIFMKSEMPTHTAFQRTNNKEDS